MKFEQKKKKKKQSDPFLPHVVGSGEEIKQQWGGRQVVVKADPSLYLRLMKIKWCGCV